MPVAVRNPENYCPICGCYLSQIGGHQCNSKTLTAIDAARKRDHVQVRSPNMAERFKEGFLFSETEDEADNELALICYVRDDAGDGGHRS